MKYRFLTYIIFLLQFGILVSSQAIECPVEIDFALSTAQEICFGTGRNQVCYGNNDVNLMPYGDDDVEFDTPGDIAEVNNIRTLSLSALDVDNGQWGIAVMRLLANLNPLESEDVTVLLFGDVEIEDASGNSEIQIVTANTYSNMRRLPNSDSPVMDSVAPGDTIHVTGRIEDNSWVRAVNPQTNIIGWIFASLLDDIDFDSLDIVATSEPYFAPMQAFYFQSGSDANDCSSVPRDGIIVQTPEGLRRVTLWVNEVTIDFLTGTGATASIQTEDDGSMSINVLEGAAYVGSDTDGYLAVAGSSINVKQSAGESVSVSKPVPTDVSVLNGLPVDVLGREIDLPEPATADQIAEVNNFVDDTTTTEITTTTTITTDGVMVDTTGNDSDTTGSGKKNCPGNSCDAPGKSKDKKDKKNK